VLDPLVKPEDDGVGVGHDPPLVIARPQAVAISPNPVIARNEVTWQSMAQGKALYLDVNHGLLRYARNDGVGFVIARNEVTRQSMAFLFTYSFYYC